MHPDMDRRQGQKRLKAGREALPADDQPTIFFLEPRKGAFSLKARDQLFDGPATRFLGLPDPFGHLGADTALPELLTQGLRIIPFIRREHFESFPWSPGTPCPDVDGVKERQDLRPFIPIGRGGAVRQGHAIPRRQTMDEHSLAFAATGNALTPTLPTLKGRFFRARE